MNKKAPAPEFDHAYSYVSKIKQRFSNQQDVYQRFLQIPQRYKEEGITIGHVKAQVAQLFKGHEDLLGEFSNFLPEPGAQSDKLSRMYCTSTSSTPPTRDARTFAACAGSSIRRLSEWPRLLPRCASVRHRRAARHFSSLTASRAWSRTGSIFTLGSAPWTRCPLLLLRSVQLFWRSSVCGLRHSFSLDMRKRISGRGLVSSSMPPTPRSLR